MPSAAGLERSSSSKGFREGTSLCCDVVLWGKNSWPRAGGPDHSLMGSRAELGEGVLGAALL